MDTQEISAVDALKICARPDLRYDRDTKTNI